MQSPIDYYKEQSEIYNEKVQTLKSKMFAFSMIRLVLFMLAVLGIYLTIKNWHLALLIGIIGVVIFIFLLLKYNRIKGERAFYNALISINEEEIKIASGDFHHRNEGNDYQDSEHYYSLDIDLFGKGSFFQFIDRTEIKEGNKKLASLLKANNIEQIELRQQAIKELRDKPQWRQFYAAKASLISVNVSSKTIVNWLINKKAFLPNIMSWLPQLFGLVSILIIGLTILNVIDNKAFIGYWLFIGLGITGVYLKKINALAVNTNTVQQTFRQYGELLNLIENETFNSVLLIEKQKQIQSEKQKSSFIFKNFVRALDALDNRNNLIGAIFGNGWFLTDLRNAYRIEKWIATYAHTVQEWFEAVAYYDALNSLGNYAFNHPQYAFPEITQDTYVISANNLGHPLIKKGKRVDSDLRIETEQFFIITGANMAGKSTFLRTVSMHIVMANVGLPVCASKSQYNPVKLITSMRTSDSLKDDSSYFFTEISRLKFVVETIETEPYFIVLDEILKGTNSTDKAIGSKKFVEKLVASNATGIIATHDLSLCEISEKLEEVKNYYFDAEIINDELFFDYKLKKGVCQNMNASFLLKKMNII